MMTLALLLAAQSSAVEVTRAPSGTELLVYPRPAPAWTEVRLALRAPADPADRPGLGAVLAEVLRPRIAALPRVGATARIERTAGGLVVAFGAPPDAAQASTEAALQALLPEAPQPEALEAARQRALAGRQAVLREDRRLADLELWRAYDGRPPPEGEVEGLAAVSEAELMHLWARAVRADRASLVLCGARPAAAAEAWLEALPIGTSTPTLLRPPPPVEGGGGLEIVVVDQPGRTQAHLLFAWIPASDRSEALSTVAAAALGPGAAWRSPLMTLTRTATVGSEPESLRAMSELVRRTRAAPPSEPAWRLAVSTATRAIALELGDPARAADALATDRVDRSRTLRPVLAERIAAQRDQPPGLSALYEAKRRIAVLITSVTGDLVPRLAEQHEGARIRVVAWDRR